MNGQCPDQGKRAELDTVMGFFAKLWIDNKAGVSEPSFCDELLEKVTARRDFTDSIDLISNITGVPYHQSYTAKAISVKESWPTALENLFALVCFLRR